MLFLDAILPPIHHPLIASFASRPIRPTCENPKTNVIFVVFVVLWHQSGAWVLFCVCVAVTHLCIDVHIDDVEKWFWWCWPNHLTTLDRRRTPIPIDHTTHRWTTAESLHESPRKSPSVNPLRELPVWPSTDVPAHNLQHPTAVVSTKAGTPFPLKAIIPLVIPLVMPLVMHQILMIKAFDDQRYSHNQQNHPNAF